MDVKIPPRRPQAARTKLRRSELLLRVPYVEPSTAAEIQIAELWQDIMNIDVIGSQDDYFDLGGDSLTATTLFLEIERKYGIRIATSEILEHSTVAKLAVLMASRSQTGGYRCLISLQPEGMDPPLFFVHDGSGAVMSYRHMLPRLGARRKIFGLQYPGPVESATSVMSIPEMATIYVDAIRATWPQGPYYLAGYSMGARIAFETASQIVAAGGEVRVLALIDGPVGKGTIGGLQREARKLSRGLSKISDVDVGRWPGFLLGALGRDLRRAWKKPRKGRQEEALPTFEVLMNAQGAAYSPPVYRGAVKIVRCTDDLGFYSKKYLGWDEYVSGPIEVFETIASHATIMNEPRVALIAACLEHWIREADAASRP
jgi:thioesterase domain-containing protein/acyl carrier protein